MDIEAYEYKLHDAFSTMIPYMQYLFDDEIAFTMSDTKKFLKIGNSKNIIMNAKAGDPLRPGGAAYECIKAQKVVSLIVPEEIFGVKVKAIGIPVKDDNGNIAGSIALAKSLKRHYEISDLSMALSDALQSISEGSNEISKKLQSAVDSNNIILKDVQEAAESAKNTDEVLNFIRSIASQTNLLGLNAAIEASRAGDQGRGFSVVAQEIRKLSNSSSNSINEINSILKKIETSVSNIESSVNVTNDSFKEQLAAVQEISSAIEKISNTALNLKKIAEEI